MSKKSDRAKALREQGLIYKEIGERLGVSHERARQLVLIADGKCQRCRQPMNGLRGRRCAACQPRKSVVGRPSRKWTPEEDKLLGTNFDKEIAAQLGLKMNFVKRRRDKLGIPSFRRQCAASLWTKELEQLIGKITDKELSEMVGVSHTTVKNRRVKLGIPPCRVQRRNKRS